MKKVFISTLFLAFLLLLAACGNNSGEEESSGNGEKAEKEETSSEEASSSEERGGEVEMLDLVRMDEYKNRYPHELSGGQQQRIALARALAPSPSLLLLDEPFSSLEADLQVTIRNELYDILKKTGTTTVFVTHDREDAKAVADRIVTMRDGAAHDWDSLCTTLPEAEIPSEAVHHFPGDR